MEVSTERERLALERERQEILEELEHLQQMLRESEVKVDLEEGDPDLHEREKNMSLVQTLEARLQSITRALRAIELGVYGICERCGQRIDPERLEAKPDATLCLTCQREAERLARRGMQRE